ncbi:MAG: hypothetical protein ISEC1_P1745 [Thiomicrorhabdus sp.]|nr:MAG: hypothetical protein ISEC1_P1745 [Thiomicrorhabdus sp.]
MLGILLSTITYAKSNQSIDQIESKKILSKCVYIASYAPGYEWQDQVTASLEEQLKEVCTLNIYYMDSKKTQSQDKLSEIALKAKDFIEKNTPNIVIISDDNAVKYVLAKYYKDHSLPFIFCGINNTSKLYKLPYSNATGMIEVAPTKALLEQLLYNQPNQIHVAYLTTQGATAKQNVKAFHNVADYLNIKSSAFLAGSQEKWRKHYKRLQEDPNVNIIILGNFVAFPEWDHQQNIDWIKANNHKLSIATQKWMMPYVALGLTKSASEQGAWAGKTARAVLNGFPIEQIPIVPNQLFQTWINTQIASPVQDKIPLRLINQATPFTQADTP